MNSVSETLAQLLLGAGESVDVLATIGLGFLRSYRDVAPLSDERLRRRCIVTAPELLDSSERHTEWKYAVQLFKNLRWDVRAYAGIPTLGCVIVDGRECLLVPLGIGPQPDTAPIFHIGRHSPLFASITNHFEQLWSLSAAATTQLANLEPGLEGQLPAIGYEQLLLSSVPSYAQEIIVASNQFWDQQIRYFSNNPTALRTTDPRHFEELIAELLDRNGLDVELTPPSGDGGRDVLAWANTLAGRHLYLVECKRYAANRPVGVEIVRALYGVVQAENATAGLIVATSEFTKGAKQFQETIKHRMDLRGYEGLIEWLRKSR